MQHNLLLDCVEMEEISTLLWDFGQIILVACEIIISLFQITWKVGTVTEKGNHQMKGIVHRSKKIENYGFSENSTFVGIWTASVLRYDFLRLFSCCFYTVIRFYNNSRTNVPGLQDLKHTIFSSLGIFTSCFTKMRIRWWLYYNHTKRNWKVSVPQISKKYCKFRIHLNARFMKFDLLENTACSNQLHKYVHLNSCP